MCPLFFSAYYPNQFFIPPCHRYTPWRTLHQRDFCQVSCQCKTSIPTPLAGSRTVATTLLPSDGWLGCNHQRTCRFVHASSACSLQVWNSDLTRSSRLLLCAGSRRAITRTMALANMGLFGAGMPDPYRISASPTLAFHLQRPSSYVAPPLQHTSLRVCRPHAELRRASSTSSSLPPCLIFYEREQRAT